jgi:glycine/D-amino acid oxidase-like deaminating enzyme
MPVLTRPILPLHVELPPRQATLAGETEVLVVGGGPAGFGAALGAAQAGAKVVLAEKYGFFGGHATAALVTILMSYYNEIEPPAPATEITLLPPDHGGGEPIAAGVLARFVERLVEAGGALAPSASTGYTGPFDPEVFKLVMLDMLDEAGVEFLLHSFASSVLGGQKVEGVVFEGKSGPLVVRARAVVDCTGDGDLAASAGAPFEIGRADGLVQPMTLMFRMAEFERQAFIRYVREHPDQWQGVYGLWDLIRRATAAGELDLPREDILFFATPHPGEVSINSTRVTGVRGIDVWDLTRAEAQARRQMRQIESFLRRYVPGFERSYLAQSGVQMGVRETRRILGGYTLTAEDVLEARKFDDVIARCCYPMDIHNPAGTGTVLKRLPPGEAFDIPLRALLPREVDNLVVAGRCISGTHEALSSYRVMPTSMATGHAAGVCAALAAQRRVSPKQLETREVQRELLRQGANLRGIAV